MSKAILICGKIGSGKSTYAEKLRIENKAVVLSCDEITLALFNDKMGDAHDEFTARTQKYLFEKSLDILEIGVNVILDWGFWQRDDRNYARTLYQTRGIPCEFHYIEIADVLWKRNITERNKAILEGKTTAYYIDDGLIEKFYRMFETPDQSEIDVWYRNESI